MQKYNHPAVSFVLSAFIFSLAMGYLQSLGFLVFVFLVPILTSLFGCTDDKHGIPLQSSSRYMFLFGFITATLSSLWIGATYPMDWIKITDPVLSVVIIGGVWFCFSFTMAIPSVLWLWVVSYIRSTGIFVRAIIGASAWVLMEYARSWLVAASVYSPETLFGPHHTYYSLEYAVGAIPYLRELIPMGGMYLTSFFVILVNYFFYYCLCVYMNKGVKKEFLWFGVFILAIVCTCVFTMKAVRGGDVREHSTFMSVVTTHTKAMTTDIIALEKNKIAEIVLRENHNPDGIVIFPENINVLSGYVQEQKPFTKKVENHLIIGSIPGKEYYTMYFFNPRDGTAEYYRKQLLMPIGEYSVSLMRNVISLSGQKDWIKKYDTSVHFGKKGSGVTLYSDPVIEGLVISGSLCSENISPYIYRDATRSGATVLVNIASHTPFHGSKLLSRQTLSLNMARALENGRYFVTASNYNNSFVIADTGEVVYMSLIPKEYSVATIPVLTHTYTTPFVRFGDYMVAISGVLLFILALWLPKESVRTVSK